MYGVRIEYVNKIPYARARVPKYTGPHKVTKGVDLLQRDAAVVMQPPPQANSGRIFQLILLTRTLDLKVSRKNDIFCVFFTQVIIAAWNSKWNSMEKRELSWCTEKKNWPCTYVIICLSINARWRVKLRLTLMLGNVVAGKAHGPAESSDINLPRSHFRFQGKIARVVPIFYSHSLWQKCKRKNGRWIIHRI